MNYDPPKQIGKWLRVSRLGNGAFGDAWVFQDSTEKNEFAVIKFLFKTEEPITVTKNRFKKERDILSKLDNPRVCRLIADDLDSNPPWIATELFGGRPLKSEISESYQLDERDWVRLANDVLEGLTYVHSLKIKHRDLNPGNIVSAAAGYRIIDFGISSQGQAQGTYSGNQRIFHRLYGSPEMYDLNQEIDEKSDIFSLATLLVFAATHRSPWTTDPRVTSDKEVTQGIFQEVAFNIQKSEPHYYSMSTNQKMLLRRMHEKDPSKRLSAEEALKELKKLSDREFVSYLAAGMTKRPIKSAPVKVATQNVKPVESKKSPKVTLTARPKLVVSKDRVEVVERSVSIDPTEVSLSGNSIKVESTSTSASKTHQRENGFTGKVHTFLQTYWKDLLIGWLATPIGWLIYRAIKNRNSSSKGSSKRAAPNLKNWKISFLLTHGLSFGFFGPFVGVPFAYRIKARSLSIFMAINALAVFIFMGEIVSTPQGSEAGTFATVIWVVNYIFGFFLPLAMRQKKSTQLAQVPVAKSQLPYTDPSYGEKIDPFDDEEYFANAQAKLQKEPKGNSWLVLRDEIMEILNDSGIERFNIEFARTNLSGIYFQGFLEKSGCVTIEAAANLSVRPEITSEQNRNIIRSGWEPPAGDNPNYIKFLDLTQSNLEFIAELIISTLRDGYGATIDGLEPVFSISMGGEIIYVDFAEFKRLTSQ